MTREVLTILLGLQSPEMLALRLGATLARDLLQHPEGEYDGPVQLLSDTKGRIRLRLPTMKQEPALARRLEMRLAAREGVSEVAANPLTGTVLVNFDETRVTRQELMHAAEGTVAVKRFVRPDDGFRLLRLKAAL